MLEFIILGQIPGTNVYVSFDTVGAIVLTLAVVSGFITTLRIADKHKQNLIDQKTI